MKTWIDLAKNPCIQGKKHAHVRFIFYWIAYEAASGEYRPDGNYYSNRVQRNKFHRKLVECNLCLKTTLDEKYNEIIYLMELRQSDNQFWHQFDQKSSDDKEWSKKFDIRNNMFRERLFDGMEINSVLNDLFSRLSTVRNQIVHGANSGAESLGRNQVAWGEKLLETLIPIFFKTIKSNPNEDWGEPPFPRVGNTADEKCSPPWLEA